MIERKISENEILKLHKTGNKATKTELEKLYPILFAPRPYEMLTNKKINIGALRDNNGECLQKVEICNAIGIRHGIQPGEGLYIQYPINKIKLIDECSVSTILVIEKDPVVKKDEKWC